jgi:hypothetical protein
VSTEKIKSLGMVELGGIFHSNLLASALAEETSGRSKIAWTPWASFIFGHTTALPQRFTTEVFSVVPGINILLGENNCQLRQLTKEAFSLGLCLCPASLALEILLQRPQRGAVNEAKLAMLPVTHRDEKLGITQDMVLSILDKEGEHSPERWLNGVPVALDSLECAGLAYLFCTKTPELVRAGYDSLP